MTAKKEQQILEMALSEERKINAAKEGEFQATVQRLQEELHSAKTTDKLMLNDYPKISLPPQLKSPPVKQSKNRGNKVAGVKKVQLPPQWLPTLLKSFHSRKLFIHEQNILEVHFHPITANIDWERLPDGTSDVKKSLLQHLFPKGSIQLVRGVLKPLHISTFLQQIRSASNGIKLRHWGDGNNGLENASRTFYAGPSSFVENLKTEQKQRLANLVAMAEFEGTVFPDSKAIERDLDVGFCDLAQSFVDWSEKTDRGEDKFEFGMFAHFVSMALGWKVQKLACWQFNFQHYLFPAHTDGCGFLKPKLSGGEGFGDQIAVAQLWGTGATWVLVVGEVPNTNDCIGIKFRSNTGDVWSMEGDARYKYMHAVAAPFPAGVHKPECLDYKVTGTFRNGLGKCA